MTALRESFNSDLDRVAQFIQPLQTAGGVLKSTNTKWLLFNLWSNPFFHADHNSADWLKHVYTSDYVITADELPSFK